MENPPTVVRQHQKHVQDLKPNCRHSKEVHRYQALDVVLEERPSRLRRWLPATEQILAHTGLADVDAELEQFAVNARRTPARVFTAHPSDQVANLP